MLNRVTLAFALAFLGLFASTGVSHAASDKTEVMVGTFLVVLGLMAFLFIVFLVKWMLGLDRMPPAEPDAGDQAHH